MIKHSFSMSVTADAKVGARYHVMVHWYDEAFAINRTETVLSWDEDELQTEFEEADLFRWLAYATAIGCGVLTRNGALEGIKSLYEMHLDSQVLKEESGEAG